MHKPTNEELEKRERKISDLITAGASRQQILEYVNTKTDWGISRASIDSLIRRAKKLFKKLSAFNREEYLGQALARLDLLFFKSFQVQDYKTALSVQKEINHLLGLSFETAMIDKIKEIEDLLTTKQLGEYSQDELSQIRQRLEQQRSKTNQIRRAKPQAA